MKEREARRRVLHAAIEADEAELAAFRARQVALEKRVEALREELRGLEQARPGTSAVTSERGPNRLDASAKVALFRGLFHGREDVFPRLWANPKTGKKGYAPACGNEWVRGVCEKPRVRCGACPSQAFVPISDQVILDHLQGRHVIGCYPLLPGETCWFVAADFDKADWRADVSAFAATCGELAVPVAIERSRSGNGAHT